MTAPQPTAEADWYKYWDQLDEHSTPATTYVDPDIPKMIRPTDVVADIGCGFGRNIEWLAKLASTVIGVDLNKSNIEHAQKTASSLHNVSLGVMDATRLGVQDKSVDVITMFGLLGAVNAPHRRAILEEARRLLTIGGLLIVSEYPIDYTSPDKQPLYERGRELTGEAGTMAVTEDRTKNGVVRFICKQFEPRELGRALLTTGFSEVREHLVTVTRPDFKDPEQTYTSDMLWAEARNNGR